jgi:transcriptional regulator with XRE-family HTH domain
VGHRLRLARALAGFNQTELGNGIGVSFQAVQKYEQADSRISASRLFAAARFLGCSVAFFFDGIEDAAVEASSVLSTELELIRALRRIANEDARESIARLITQIGHSHGDEEQDRNRHTAC